MQATHSVKSILISLIESIDMYNHLLKNHHRRTAVIAYQLGNQFDLTPGQMCNLVLASSIHDIGALYVAERDRLLYIDAVDTEPHEVMGERILKDFKPFKYISKIIRHHHILYQEIESGKIKREDVPIECFVLHLADRIDVLLATYEREGNPQQYVIDEINKRFGTTFLPELKEAFNTLAKLPDFWENIDDSPYHDLLLMSIEDESCIIDSAGLESLAALFARVVDFKSPWTTYHSKSVSVLAEQIGRVFGLSEEKCFEMKIAGYLHDIGKIAIPTEILDKPAKLDDGEFKTMKTHATFSSIILSKISVLGEIGKWASGHHEKRDKSGYPLRKGTTEFSVEMDILVFADIFAALAENRPYRSAMPKEKIIEILKSFTPDQLDEGVYRVIEQNFDYLYDTNADMIKAYSLN